MSEDDSKKPSWDRAIRVGARHCVVDDVYRSSLKMLLAEIEGFQTIDRWEPFCRYTNLLSLYMVLMYSMCTGVRAVISPLPGIEEIDPVTGFHCIGEKDSNPPYHGRAAWVLSFVHEQLRLYSRYIARAAEVIQQAPRSNPFELSEGFLISERGFAIEIRPREQQKIQKPFLDAPANAHRRMLQSRFLSDGMPYEFIAAFMGHWSYGEEPWSQFSAFEYGAHRQMLEQHLVPYLQQLGFKLLTPPAFHAFKVEKDARRKPTSTT